MKFVISEESDISLEGLDRDQYLEVSEVWTRRESKALDEATINEVINEWLPKKLISMRIVDSLGNVHTDPKTLNLENDWMDDLDQRVYGMLSNVLYKTLTALFFLGAGIVKPSSSGTESGTQAKKTKTA